MRKTDKKRERDIINQLESVCQLALETRQPAGFLWLTHTINHQRPLTLTVTCVFEACADAAHASRDNTAQSLNYAIKTALAKVGIKLINPVQFDSEQACNREHAGNWKRRLSQH